MKRSPVRSVSMVAVLFAGVLLGGCGKQEAKAPETPRADQSKARMSAPAKVRIGYQPIIFYAYLFLGEKEGIFRDAGLDVEMIKIASANEMFQAFLAGQLDATGLTATEIMCRAYEKQPGSFFCPLLVELNGESVHDNVYVLNASTISDVKGLAGKKIGSHPGTTVPNIMKTLLTKEGVGLDAVTIQELKPELQVDALLSGAVDALICFEPSGARVSASGKARILYPHPFGVVEANFPASYTVIAKEFRGRDAKACQALVQAIGKCVSRYRELARSDKATIDRLLVDKLGLDVATAAKIAPVTYRLPEEWDPKAFSNVVSFYVRMGVLSKPLRLEDIR